MVAGYVFAANTYQLYYFPRCIHYNRMESAIDHTDLSSVDSSVIDVVEEGGEYRSILEGELIHYDLFSTINAKYPSQVKTKECEVQVEYKNTGSVVYSDAFQNYLDTYTRTIATPERIANNIRKDIEEVMECDPIDVYVQLNYKNDSKTVIIGSL